MYADVVSAIQAGIGIAPAMVGQQGEGWTLFSPISTPDEAAGPCLMVMENGTLMAFNTAGSQILQTLAFTGGSA